MKRRLAAILVADVVGYSRLMEADEAGTLAALQQRRTSVLDPVVRDHSGRIVKVMGDGVLIEFASAVNAVNAALALQRGMTAASAELPKDRRIVMRIGINLGDVIGEGRDIYGESVNIAARLETLADPGGICISSKVHEEVASKIDCGFQDMGPQSVKNISRPVRAWRVQEGGTGAAPPALALPDKPSIAVLPFQNMSADAEQEYFADGIVEDIITELSRAKWLFVIARNSSFTYKGRAVDIKQVGRELGVRYVLEGSVRRAGARIRITGQLIDAATGAHLWADRYDGAADDVFELQDQVTQSVLGAIAPKLELAEIDRSARKPTESLVAYDHYLRGMAAFHAFTGPANDAALAHFTRACKLDPGYAAAYGMAARCYVQRTGFGWTIDRAAEISEALRLARKATELGTGDAIALAAGGHTFSMFGNVTDGDALLSRALEVDPNFAWAWSASGFARALLGDHDATVEHSLRALRFSPQDPQIFSMTTMVALGHFLARRYDEALPFAREALRHSSKFALAAAVAAACGAQTGDAAMAETAMRRLQEIDPKLRTGKLLNWLNFQRPEDAAHCAEALHKAGLPE